MLLKFGKWFHPTLYNGCNYLSALGLKLILLLKGVYDCIVIIGALVWLPSSIDGTRNIRVNWSVCNQNKTNQSVKRVHNSLDALHLFVPYKHHDPFYGNDPQ